MDRRRFLGSAAAVGAGLVLAPESLAMQTTSKTNDLNVALIGAGDQGKVLAEGCLKMGKNAGVRFKAVCDIWPYNRNKIVKRLKAYDHQPNPYTDYREMLDREKDLDAAIIATPDFCHAEQTIACLNAHLHVYCETEMATTIEDAKKMVQAAKKAGRVLQIGRQRRSSPLYIHCAEKLIKEAKILGRLTAVNAQFNSSVRTDRGAPKKYALDQARLEKYGYKSMAQLRNWRWYKKLGSGPVVEHAAHQLDVVNWLLGTNPKSVMASGSINFYDKDTHQWFDNAMVIFEYQLEQRTVSAFYQAVTTNGSQGHFEKFMGTEGTLILSEESGTSAIYREDWVPEDKWDQWPEKGYLTKIEPTQHPSHDEDSDVEVQPSLTAATYKFPVDTDAPCHQLHLKNFFEAVRGKTTLTCPAELAYKSAVTTLKINEAIETGRKIQFRPQDFKA